MKDYYLLLGISKNADKDEIKKAYRDSAKKYHPDASPTVCDPKQFKEISEAYQTLSDNNKREAYDRKYIRKVPIFSHQSTEPLKPTTPTQTYRYSRRFHTHNPFPPYTHSGRPSEKSLHCLIQLTPQEIQYDVEYPFTISILTPCPRCYDRFSGFLFFCPTCLNDRYIYGEKELIINIPKGTNNGTIVELNLDHVGLKGANLLVEVKIA
jgi:DnaJ-class molecular chaperone